MNSESRKLKKPYVTGGKILIWIGIGFYVIVIVTVLFHDKLLDINPKVDWESTTKWDTLSQIGGFIGGFITPVWTLIGALFIYQTLVYQQESTEKQENQIRSQQFENTLMHMMQRQDRIKNEIEFMPTDSFVWIRNYSEPSNEKLKGDFFLKYAQETFRTWFEEGGGNAENGDDFCSNERAGDIQKLLKDTPPMENVEQRLIAKAKAFFDYYQIYFDHYFGHLESILELFDQAIKDKLFKIDDDYHPYIKMFKAQLTITELYYIFYGSLSRYPSIRKLVIKFQILDKNIDDLLDQKHKAIYLNKPKLA